VNNSTRLKHRDLLVGILGGIIAKWRVHDLYEALIAAGVPAGPVNDLAQVFADPHVRSRGMMVDVPHPLAGTVQMVANPIRYSETEIVDYAPPPNPGEHTVPVLTELLGLDEPALGQLRAAKVIA
jgi:crotonobetainyl-CoA:carnitine CoA-transferase CaiB-like acyl-CoA transferase